LIGQGAHLPTAIFVQGADQADLTLWRNGMHQSRHKESMIISALSWGKGSAGNGHS
jgi:hypothetical protein